MHLLAIITIGIFAEIPFRHISYITAHNLADLILKCYFKVHPLIFSVHTFLIVYQNIW